MTSPDNQGGEAPSATPLDRVGELLKEREQYEQWIAALEAKKDRTPPHVYDRVRGDYERRRKEVIAEISGHASEIRQALEQARERHARLAQQESTRRDERAEMELRHLVGEYTEEQWRVLSSRTDTEIQQLSEAREAAKRALAQLEDVVRVATPAQSVGTVGGPAGRSETGGAASGPPQPGSAQFDELAFLKSVVGPQKSGRGSVIPAPVDSSPLPPEFHVAAAAAPPQPPPPVAPAAPAPPPAPPVAAAPEPAAPVRYATPVGQMPLQPPIAAAQPPAPSRPTPVSAEPVGAGAGAKASPETGKVPAFLKDVPTESVKTLKCRDCGTMNLPTEWYCERCGGELADIS